jgi:nucleoside-diphosphate-sugar epimerase
VLGAGSQIGGFLLPRLVRAGLQPVRLPRTSTSGRPAAATLSGQSGDAAPAVAKAICLAPVDVLPHRLNELHGRGVRRLIAFSTTGVFYKSASADDAERRRIERIAAAEESVTRFCDAHDIAWTLFRPTLVYGSGRDRNVAVIAQFVRRFGFFPLVDGGRGLRQPVHAEDLADACVQGLDQPLTHGKAYTLSGAQILTYRQMVEAVFAQLGREPRLVPVPLAALRAALAVVRRIPGLQTLSPEMASRMRMDLCFEHGEATRDFGFRPRPFRLDASSIPSA